MNICVYGAASDRIAPKFLAGAQALGTALANAGLGVVFGGGATGVMGALARGVQSAGGKLIGVAPRFFDRPGVLVTFCPMEWTDTMRQRKERMEVLSQGFIMAPGGIGTLEEFFEILTLRQLGRHEKPIAILNLDGCYDSLITLLQMLVEEGFLDRQTLDRLRVFREPEECARWFRDCAAQERILVSACLLGEACTYTGGSNPCPALEQIPGVKVPICPEVLGGLPIPRPPAERVEDRVLTREGSDVTQAYRDGAAKALAIAKENGCTRAILKARSPSCGVGQIYDGSFSHRIISRDGVAAEVLRQAGLQLETEEDL